MLYPNELRAHFGRGGGIRTPDILLPKQARYQTALYPADPSPAMIAHRAASARAENLRHRQQRVPEHPLPCIVARPERFELPTTKFVAWYSIQLSYGREEAELFRQNLSTSTPIAG